MSVSTEERLNRLKELELKRLQRQAEIFSENRYEPSIMPKFESRITLSRSTVSDSNQQKYDSKNREDLTTKVSEVKNVTEISKDNQSDSENEEVISEVYEMDVSGFSLISSSNKNEESKSKEEEPSTTAEIAEKQDSALQNSQELAEKKDSSSTSTISEVVETHKVPKIEETSAKTKESELSAIKMKESSNKINVSTVDSSKSASEDNLSSDIDILTVNSEPHQAVEKEKPKTEMSDADSEPKVSSLKCDTNPNTQASVVISDPPRTLSTSYVGPLSPTSSEKTRISVVRKMTLDSLPTVTTVIQESPVHKYLHSTETQIEKAKQTDATKPHLTLKEFRLRTVSNESSLLSENVESTSKKEAKDTCDKTNDILQQSAENTDKKALSVAKIEVGPTLQSPVTEETVTTDTDVQSTINLSESATSSITLQTDNLIDNGQEVRTSVVEENLNKTDLPEPSQASASAVSTTHELTSTNKIASDTKTESKSDSGHSAEPSVKCSESTGNELVVASGSDTAAKSEEVIKKYKKEFEENVSAHYASLRDEEEMQRSRIHELEKKRKELNKGKEKEEEDLSQLSVRERFFRTQTKIRRPVKQLSVAEQIRAKRLSRRNSDYNEAPSSEVSGKAAEAESPPSVRRSRLQARSVDRLRRRTIDSVPVLPTGSSSNVPEEKPKLRAVIDTEAIGEAFERHNRERLSRIDALERLRAQNRELSRRRDSDPALSLGASASGTRSDYQSSLIVNRGSSENIAQFPIHEHLESSFPSRFSYLSSNDAASRRSELLRTVSIDRSSVVPSSLPALRPSYSESRLFPLDGGRLSGILSMSTESDLSQLQQSTNQQQFSHSDNSGIHIFGDITPQGVSTIDNEMQTHLDRATGPKKDTYSSIVDQLENRNRDDAFELMFLPPHRRRAMNRTNNLLDPINHDHFLADCFDKKYTLKERCALIRDKIYSTDNSERGKPDGASHDNIKTKGDETDTSN